MTRRTIPVRECRRCGETRPTRARDLCHGCYSAMFRAGTLDQYPPLGPDGTGKGSAREKPHGGYTRAIRQKCQCDPCRAHYRTYYDRENDRRAAARRAAGAVERPAISAAMRARKANPDKPAPAQPLELGNPDHADEVVLQNALNGRPADARHPDDRAAVLRAYRAGHLGKNVALKAMHCSTAQLDATLAQLENAA